VNNTGGREGEYYHHLNNTHRATTHALRCAPLFSSRSRAQYITRAVRKARICDLYSLAGAKNATGRAVKKVDVLSNEVRHN
jgi:fructose-1,6-bisphosphatase